MVQVRVVLRGALSAMMSILFKLEMCPEWAESLLDPGPPHRSARRWRREWHPMVRPVNQNVIVPVCPNLQRPHLAAVFEARPSGIFARRRSLFSPRISREGGRIKTETAIGYTDLLNCRSPCTSMSSTRSLPGPGPPRGCRDGCRSNCPKTGAITRNSSRAIMASNSGGR